MDILNILTPSCFLSKIDWTLAFNHIGICEEDRRYLCFRWKSRYFQFCCHPNGQSNAPYVINYLCRPIIKYLSSLSINLNLYIDNSHLYSRSFTDMERSIDITLDIFHRAGFTINYKKSVLAPVQKITFLGFDIDTVEFSVAVSKRKRYDLFQLVNSICQHPRRKVSIRFLAKIIGKIIATFPASDHAPLHYRALDRFKVRMLVHYNQKWTQKVMLSYSCIKQLTWWRDNVQTDKMKHSLYTRNPTLHLYVDSSGEAWGSVLGSRVMKSVFSEEQKQLHINTKELLAVYYGINSHLDTLKGQCFVVFSDNSTTVSILKKKSSADKLRDRIVGRIFDLIFEYNMSIRVSWLSSAQNFLADKASRSAVKNPLIEWSCHKDTISFIKNLPQFQANIDLFASHLNNILPVFASFTPCPGSIMTDCFNLNWDNYVGFIHCAPRLIPKCLHHIDQNQVKLIQGIFPVRPTANWWVPLVSHLKLPPVLLPKNTANKLFLPWDKSIRHPLARKMRMCFMTLCANCYVDTNFLKELQSMLQKMVGTPVLQQEWVPLPADGCSSPRKRKFRDLT